METQLFISSYLFIGIVILSFILAKNLNTDRKNSPLWPLIISNISFWFYLKNVYIFSETFVKIIALSSFFCIIYYFWIRIKEFEVNHDRGFVKEGKDSILKGYNDTKQNAENIASDYVGGGYFGNLFGSFIDLGTQKTENKLSGFLNFFDSEEYFHPSRGLINTIRNILIIIILFNMVYHLF